MIQFDQKQAEQLDFLLASALLRHCTGIVVSFNYQVIAGVSKLLALKI